ncbi:MAG: hypothetical protein ACKPA9_00385, partial [Microcystis sp.]
RGAVRLKNSCYNTRKLVLFQPIVRNLVKQGFWQCAMANTLLGMIWGSFSCDCTKIDGYTES